MPGPEHKPIAPDDIVVDEQQQAQSARDANEHREERGPAYGEASADTDSDGGLNESESKSR